MTYIIFDTNAARDFVQGIQLEELDNYVQRMERAFSVRELKMLVSPIVVQELLCHLEDSSDRDYSVSFKAIKVMMLMQEAWQHGEEKRIMLPPADMLIIHEIYNQQCIGREKMYGQILNIATAISHGTISQIPDFRPDDGVTLKQHVDEVEHSFAQQIKVVCKHTEMIAENMGLEFEDSLNNPDVENLIITYFSRTAYNILLAEGKVPDYHLFSPPSAQLTLENARKVKHFMDFMKNSNMEIKRRYPAFLALAKEVVRRIYQSQYHISDDKLHNYVWDILLMFHVNDHTISQEPCIFITSDKAMLLSSGAFHDRHKVMNYGELKEMLLS